MVFNAFHRGRSRNERIHVSLRSVSGVPRDRSATIRRTTWSAFFLRFCVLSLSDVLSAAIDVFRGGFAFEDGFFHVGILPPAETADGVDVLGLQVGKERLGRGGAVFVEDDVGDGDVQNQLRGDLLCE